MDEYIKKEDAFDVSCAECEAGTFYDIPSKIMAIPPADVRPVVRGRWITRPYMMGNTQYCSLCGENYGRKHNFCPNCGADMREES